MKCLHHSYKNRVFFKSAENSFFQVVGISRDDFEVIFE